MPDILESVEDRVAIITLNRPESLNALSEEIRVGMRDAITKYGHDNSIGCIVVTGNGRGFCAGGDVKTMAGRSARVFEERAEQIRNSNNIALLMNNVPKPIIGMINGVAVGAGLSMACACDIRIAATSARFGSGFIKIGLSGDWGGTWTVTRLIGTAKAREMFFTGDIIDAEEALRIGLVNKVVADAELRHTTMELARRIASMSPIALGYTKKNLSAAETGSFEASIELEAVHQARCSQTEDHREAVAAFKEKRKPVFQGR
ncbi:MAG: enoyl-CoA hydratase [Proteobacteria bacterium]|nr:enoyl-CoA hydratase [Pseudomonadota bacterium]